MSRQLAVVVLSVAAATAMGCQQQSKGASSGTTLPSSQARNSCSGAVSGVDSSFAIRQAKAALAMPGMTLEPRLIQPVRDEGIELGLLISLAVTQPRNTVGGGGLVWVDVETGCAIVLRRYE